MNKIVKLLLITFLIVYQITTSAQTEKNPLILTEMTWVDVQSYLKNNDMVIIPLGST
jgi:hypothetical protein